MSQRLRQCIDPTREDKPMKFRFPALTVSFSVLLLNGLAAAQAAAPAPPAAPTENPGAAATPPAPEAGPAPAAAGQTAPAVGAAPVPMPGPAPAAAAPEAPAAAAPPSEEGFSPTDPLAGYTGDTAFLRSADNNFVFLPNGRLQVDGYFYKRDTAKMPKSTLLVRRARLELGGWIGKMFYYNIAGDFAAGAPAGADPVAQSWSATTDDYVAIAPFKNTAILQVGQFDAPFTLENRTSDKYFDFMERSLTVRAFGVPSNKEVGAMVHGLLPSKVLYYSVGVFNGDGQNFKNVDNGADLIGRAWVAPFAAAGIKDLEDAEIGGSVWLGTRKNGLPLAKQSTQGDLKFLDPGFKQTVGTTTTPYELHQDGSLKAFAVELNVPFQHKMGARVEYVHKRQELSAMNITDPVNPLIVSGATLKGWAMYGELYYWLVGDDTIIGAPGLQLPTRLKKFETKAPKDGVMVAARVDHISEQIDSDAPLPSSSVLGTRRVTAAELGVNYWYSKRFRASFNYVVNFFGGDSPSMKKLTDETLAGHKNEHEFLFRLAVAL